ncbi:hypothetical protein KPL70_023668 [Citrus sinensis]|nr:hypothetical protein KPL70_023668 [Citrus sinensis]
MRKYKSVEFQFHPEIERTARRLRREHRELQAAVAMDDLQDLRNLNHREEIQPVNVHEDRAIRDYTVLTPQAIHPGIDRPDVQADNFELKPVMFQMLQTMGQFNGLSSEDPHLHLKLFLESYQNQTAAAPSGHNRLTQPPGFYQQNQEQRSINNDQLSSLEALIKDYIVKNEAVIQSHAASLRNLENQIGQLAIVLSNIPQALEQMSNYAKFLKDILTKKRRLGEFETVALTQECSRILQSEILKKMKDPGSFTIPCSIGTKYSSKTLCDLGASINLMHLSVFKQLGVGECKPTTMTLQLTDRSYAYPEGKIEDVLVKVDKFIFPVDFIVLYFEADKEVPIILGRPFLATGKTLIDVQKGELTMRVNDQQVTFNVLDAMKS